MEFELCLVFAIPFAWLVVNNVNTKHCELKLLSSWLGSWEHHGRVSRGQFRRRRAVRGSGALARSRGSGLIINDTTWITAADTRIIKLVFEIKNIIIK